MSDARKREPQGDSTGSFGGRRMSGDRSPGLSAGEFAGIGVQFAATILVFTFIGVWLKGRLAASAGLGVLILILFVFLGAGGGFYSIYRKVTMAQRREQTRIAAARKGSRGSSAGSP